VSMADAQGPAGSKDDAGAVVVGWFAKIAITIALLGTLAFDGVSIAVARAHVTDIASDAADAASSRFIESGPAFSAVQALDAAQSKATSEGGSVAPSDLVITRQGHVTTITVTVHYLAGTVLLGHLPGTGQLQQTTATASRTVRT